MDKMYRTEQQAKISEVLKQREAQEAAEKQKQELEAMKAYQARGVPTDSGIQSNHSYFHNAKGAAVDDDDEDEADDMSDDDVDIDDSTPVNVAVRGTGASVPQTRSAAVASDDAQIDHDDDYRGGADSTDQNYDDI